MEIANFSRAIPKIFITTNCIKDSDIFLDFGVRIIGYKNITNINVWLKVMPVDFLSVSKLSGYLIVHMPVPKGKGLIEKYHDIHSQFQCCFIKHNECHCSFWNVFVLTGD